MWDDEMLKTTGPGHGGRAQARGVRRLRDATRRRGRPEPDRTGRIATGDTSRSVYTFSPAATDDDDISKIEIGERGAVRQTLI